MEETNVKITDIDGKEYIELDTIMINDNKYVYLVNKNDDKDFIINKIVVENEKEYYEGLSSNEEFQIALLTFIKENKNIISKL